MQNVRQDSAVQHSAKPEELIAQLQDYLENQPSSVLVENGRILFDLRVAKIEITAEHGRCILHVWSEEQDLIRHVVGITVRKTGLRLHVMRMGQTKPQTIELHPQQRRLPSQRDSTRTCYIPLLERVLTHHFPQQTVEALRTAMDLERSFGPAYARGLLVQGNRAWAVIAINREESQALTDGILTLGILWLHHCREQAAGRRVIEGLRIILPKGKAAVTASRLAWLHPKAAQWELYELDESTESLYQRLPADSGNVDSRLVHAPNVAAAEERFASAMVRVRDLLPSRAVPQMETVFRSGSEAALLWHGLEFARIRITGDANSFDRSEEILLGSGAQTTRLTEDTAPALREMLAELVQRRHAGANKRDVLYRQQPERWLESILRRSLDALDAMIESHPVYSQVPAFTGADHSVLDLLAVRRDGRLVIVEIKADEDLHFVLQALDYWIRVRQHHLLGHHTGDFSSDLQRYGYFPGKHLQPEAPWIYLVAPALRIHPATEVILRYLSPEIHWTLMALDERWREKIRVVFRKRSH